MPPFISIVIPIYNVARFIPNGLQCIFNQLYNDYEIILINDGSTDNSGQICNDYANAHNNITIIHQDNSGTGEARNKGILTAKGEYIWFFDIDDYAMPHLLTTCVDILKANKPELLCFSFTEYDNTLKAESPYTYDNKHTMSNSEVKESFMHQLLNKTFNNGFVWNKIYQREFLIRNNILFESQRIQQDEIFNLKVYPKLQTMITIPNILYRYYIYSSGNTRSYYIQNRHLIYFDVKNAFIDLFRHWDINDTKAYMYVYDRLFKGLITSLTFNLFHTNNSLTRNEKKEIMRNILNHTETLDCINKNSVLHPKNMNLLQQNYFYGIKNKSIAHLYITFQIEALLNRIKLSIRRILKLST